MSFSPSSSILNRSLAWSLGNEGKGHIRIQFPFRMEWYHEQPCSKFRSLEHRKEPKGFRHEFILFYLLDGSICRMERTGDPTARLNALGSRGCIAYDVAQCYRPEDNINTCFEGSEMVSCIQFPRPMDLIDVLKICRAIHECGKPRNYTLQVFNCYFFAVAVQCCLARSITGWEHMTPDQAWVSELHQAVASMSAADLFIPTSEGQSSTKVLLDTCHVLGHIWSFQREQYVDVIQQILSQQGEHIPGLNQALKKELWFSNLNRIPCQILNTRLRESILQMVKSALPDDNRIDDLARLRKDCLSLVLNLVSRFHESQPPLQTPQLQTSPLQTLYIPSVVGTIDTGPQGSQRITEMDYRGVVAVDVEQEITSAQWLLICWCHIKLIILRFINIFLWRNRPFGKPNQTSTVVIEKKLAHLSATLTQTGPTTLSSLYLFRGEINAMLHNEAAVWEKSPWGDVGLAIEAHASTTPFSGHEAIKLKVEYKGSAQYEVTVSDFQDYIKGRIMGQATLVERVKLGSAIGVQLELLEKLSEVWTLIRDNGLEPPAPTLPAKYMPNQLAESELWYERDVHVERDRLSRHADRSYHLPQNVYGSSSDGAPSESNVPTSASVVDRHPESFVSPVGMGQVAQAPAPMYRYTGASKQNSGSHSPTGIPTPERIRVIPSQEEYSEPHVVRIGGGSSPALPQIVRVTAPRPVAANSVPQVIHIGRSDQLAGPEIIRVAVPRS